MCVCMYVCMYVCVCIYIYTKVSTGDLGLTSELKDSKSWKPPKVAQTSAPLRRRWGFRPPSAPKAVESSAALPPKVPKTAESAADLPPDAPKTTESDVVFHRFSRMR